MTLRFANCACINWCRLWEETQGGKYPASAHHPRCSQFVTEEFTVLEYDGAWCVMEPGEAQQVIAESEEQYNVSTVRLTRDQFENMPEFTGF